MSKTVIEYALKIDDNGSLNLLDGETKKLVKSLEKAKKAASDSAVDNKAGSRSSDHKAMAEVS